jgi:hypothetical protein
LSTVFPASKTTIVGGVVTPATSIVCSRVASATCCTTSPLAVPTRMVTGIRKTAGVVKRRPVLSALLESSCVCVTVSVSLEAAVSYLAATVNWG